MTQEDQLLALAFRGLGNTPKTVPNFLCQLPVAYCSRLHDHLCHMVTPALLAHGLVAAAPDDLIAYPASVWFSLHGMFSFSKRNRLSLARQALEGRFTFLLTVCDGSYFSESFVGLCS